MTTQELAKTENRQLSKITAEEIRSLLIPANVPQPTDQEVALFVRVCQETGLNPFLKQIYLVKASDDMPAAIIPAAQSWEARADQFPLYDGYEAGLLVYQEGKVNERQGCLVIPGEIMGKQIIGGYAKVYRKDRSKPFYLAVSYQESLVTKRDGTPNRFWAKQPAYQLRLSALRKALKEAFPNEYPDALFNEEQQDNWDENTGEYKPIAFQGKAEPRWDAFWAKLKEVGVNHEKACEILECGSIKVWANNHSLEEAYTKILEHIRHVKNEKDKDDLFGNQRDLERQTQHSAVEPPPKPAITPQNVQGAASKVEGNVLTIPAPDKTTPAPRKWQNWGEFAGALPTIKGDLTKTISAGDLFEYATIMLARPIKRFDDFASFEEAERALVKAKFGKGV